MRTKLSCILDNYWRRKQIYPKLGKYLRTVFGAGRGVTQGEPASPIILNIVVHAVVRAVLEGVYIPKEEHPGIGLEAGDINIVFYTDNGSISERDN